MGLAIDTSETFPLVLQVDADKPAAVKPQLDFRFVSSREWKLISRKFDEAGKANSTEGLISGIEDALRIGLAGWANQLREGQIIPYDPANLDEVLSTSEVLEVRRRLLDAMTLAEEDKKKSRLPSPSNTDASASVTNLPAPAAAAPA